MGTCWFHQLNVSFRLPQQVHNIPTLWCKFKEKCFNKTTCKFCHFEQAFLFLPKEGPKERSKEGKRKVYIYIYINSLKKIPGDVKPLMLVMNKTCLSGRETASLEGFRCCYKNRTKKIRAESLWQ